MLNTVVIIVLLFKSNVSSIFNTSAETETKVAKGFSLS